MSSLSDAGQHHAPTVFNKISFLFAGWCTGVIESLLHPFDTIAKRIQKHGGIPKSIIERNKIIYPDKGSTLTTLWKGYGESLFHKFILRGAAFGSQPFIHDAITKHYGEKIEYLAGKRFSSTFTQFAVGGSMGLIEVAFLPIDKLKLKRQLGNELSAYDIFKTEKLAMYHGISVTAARNMLSFSTLFGVSDLLKKTTFEQPLHQGQHISASFLAAICAVIVTNPFDCVKTRVQSSTSKVSVGETIKELSREGPRWLLKGLGSRMVFLSPRLTLGKTVVDFTAPLIDQVLCKNSPNSKNS